MSAGFLLILTITYTGGFMSIFKRFSKVAVAVGVICAGTVFAQGPMPITWNVGVAGNPGGVGSVVAAYIGGTLNIDGEGAMQNFGTSASVPWNSYRDSITNVRISRGVTNIGNNSFYEYTALKTVEIGGTVTNIGSFAFSRSGLTSLSIPFSVTTIGDNAISFLRDLTSIFVFEGNTHFSAVDGVLFNLAQDTLILYPPNREGTSYTIPNSVKMLRNQSFQHSRNLTTVTIPEGVTNAANNQVTFAYMSALTSITLPNSMTFANTSMFQGSNALKSVTLGTDVTLVSRGAFAGCTALESITFLGTTPPETPQGALWSFISTNNMDSSAIKLYVPLEAVEAYREHDIWGKFHSVSPILNRTWECGTDVRCSFNSGIFTANGTGAMANYTSANTAALSKASSVIAPVTTPWEIYKSLITSVIIEDGVTSIGNAAFDGSENLTSVKIGSGVTSIGEMAFHNCNNIDSIHIFSAAPPAVAASTFTGVDLSAARVFVPEANIEAYTEAEGWNEFQDITSHAATSVQGGAAFNRNRANSLSPVVSVIGKTLNVRIPQSMQSSSTLQVRMIDMRGRTAANFNTMSGTNNSFQLTKIPAGSYIVEVRNAGTRLSTTPVMVR